MLGSKVKHYFVTGVAQEVRSGLHRFENACFPFDSQVDFQSFGLRHKSNQRFGLMNVQANPSPDAI